MENPTQKLYSDLSLAYNYFNEYLFDNKLPSCLLTVRGSRKMRGYFSGKRFRENGEEIYFDEIALNPYYFEGRTTKEILSTLVHEQVHLQHHHFGKKVPKTGYHNKEWVSLMEEIGLTPSSTGKPGGKQTGISVSHYIKEGGKFDIICDNLLKTDFNIKYIELKEIKHIKPVDRVKYTCDGCDIIAYGKKNIHIICKDCNLEMNEETE